MPKHMHTSYEKTYIYRCVSVQNHLNQTSSCHEKNYCIMYVSDESNSYRMGLYVELQQQHSLSTGMKLVIDSD